jgi:transposase
VASCKRRDIHVGADLAGALVCAPGLDRCLAWTGARRISTGDCTILGQISKRGNRYLRVLFVSSKIVKGGRPGLAAADRATQAKIVAISLAASVAFGVIA